MQPLPINIAQQKAQLWGCDITAQQQPDPLCFGKMSLRPFKGAITTCVVKAAHSTESAELFNKQNNEDWKKSGTK
ncbi:hypothetical protein Pelo_19224 [Pelomyxa schiedti]|nr:hypothetical protein Pelo_19224 [Pelomyxa schiedti]